MAARKAQMFVVTAIFLASMLFVVQQSFITYSSLDISSPFRTKQLYVLNNVMNSVEETIKTTATCQEFDKNINELLSLLRDDVSREGFILETGYVLNCARWSFSSGEPPLKLTIRLSETYDINGNVLDFYHI